VGVAVIGAAFATLDWPRKLMTLSGAIDNAWVSLPDLRCRAKEFDLGCLWIAGHQSNTGQYMALTVLCVPHSHDWPQDLMTLSGAIDNAWVSLPACLMCSMYGRDCLMCWD
jgi:hypothetical protein